MISIFNKIFLSIVFIFAFGCGKKKADNSSSPGSFNATSLQEAQEKYCKEDEVLKEDDFAVDHNFEDITLLSKVVGFSYGSESCAFEKDINEDWKDNNNQDMSLNIDIKSRCIPNNSLWAISSVATSDKIQTVAIKALDHSSEPDILIKASKNLNGKYLKEKVGFRVLTCKKI
jgi:hypothetical protein